MAADASFIETFGKTPFVKETALSRTMPLSDLAKFLMEEKPTALRPEQQKALIPIAAEVAIRTQEEAIAKEFHTPPTNTEVKIRKFLDETLRGQREANITDVQLTRAIELARRLNPSEGRGKNELQRLGQLADRYSSIMRSRTPFLKAAPSHA